MSREKNPKAYDYKKYNLLNLYWDYSKSLKPIGCDVIDWTAIYKNNSKKISIEGAACREWTT